MGEKGTLLNNNELLVGDETTVPKMTKHRFVQAEERRSQPPFDCDQSIPNCTTFVSIIKCTESTVSLSLKTGAAVYAGETAS